MREEIENWIKQANKDLEVAEKNFNIGEYYSAAFWCQQATEKGLKAVLIEKTKKFPKIHDLVRLGKLAKIDERLLKECEKLTFVYTETRYPDTGDREYTKQEAEDYIKIAEEIMKWVIEKLS